VKGRASDGSNMPHWIRNNILDFLRAMSVKIAVENGKIRIGKAREQPLLNWPVLFILTCERNKVICGSEDLNIFMLHPISRNQRTPPLCSIQLMPDRKTSQCKQYAKMEHFYTVVLRKRHSLNGA